MANQTYFLIMSGMTEGDIEGNGKMREMSFLRKQKSSVFLR